MAESRNEYSIGAVAELTNLTAHTIRVWERRYGAVQPIRSAGGTRRYTDRDVERLRVLSAAVQGGHRIGDIVTLDERALAELLRATPHAEARGTRSNPKLDDLVIERVIRAADALNLRDVEGELGVHFRLLGPEDFVQKLICPLLHRVGELWEAGRLSMATEHLISASARQFLLKTFETSDPGEGAPRILFTTAEQEQHDLGLLMAAGSASRAGAHVVNLGAQLPPDSVADAATRLNATAVALSMVHLRLGAQRSYLMRLREQLPAHIEIWLGGEQAYSGIPGCQVLTLDQMVDAISRYTEAQETA